ncbi:C40 family peptidase [Alteribacter populi]|uniref:C40 family peptidase n=1 Tax=Alteribacter populi TaxID=2011011 RepID=UPI000BBAB972|nr:C40 family peptidase [Alteribacter populi]
MGTNNIISTGLHHLGVPYLYNAPPFQTNTFDCSSFIQYIFHKNGITLPRNSRQQFQIGSEISLKKIERGDLLFFTTSKRRKRAGIEKIGHVALYLGNGKILHTFRQGKKVKITKLKSHWKKGLIGARRIHMNQTEKDDN